MAALWVFLSLSVFLLLEHQTLAYNDAPCLPSYNNNAYNTFVKHHICFNRPNTYQGWKAYIQRIGGCNRPTQSFLRCQDLDQIKAVCTWCGGKFFMGNLCISNYKFTFTTVRIEIGTCNILSVTPENKHLILACDRLDNQCLPVHFEGNPGDQKPHWLARGCEAPTLEEIPEDIYDL